MKLVSTHYVYVTRGDESTVVCDFYAPSEDAAKIMGRAYVRSLVAHTKNLSKPVTREMCHLAKK
jgi:hypothetical protein